MPEGIGNIEIFDMIHYNIKDQIRNGAKVNNVTNQLRKIVGSQTAYYWFENNGEIILGAEFSINSQNYTVNAVAKSPNWRKKTPYATDLYKAVLDDTNKSIRIFRDYQMSNSGLDMWKKLLDSGCHISVYDSKNPGVSFKEIHDTIELENYFKDDDTNFRRYQYVLSEGQVHLDVIGFFNTRRMRELSGISLI